MHPCAHYYKICYAVGQPVAFLIFIMPFCRPFLEALPLQPV
jgi:hypothetical protein